MSRCAVVVIILLGLLTFCNGLKGGKYLPGESVPVFTNTIGPYSNPSVTYEYYSLPFCKPDVEHLIKAKQTLGMAIEGDRLFNSLYEHQFLTPVSRQVLCKKELNRDDIEKFKKSISKVFFYELWVDGLPAHGFVGSMARAKESEITEYYLFTHLHFTFLFNEDRIIHVNVTSDMNRSNLVHLKDQPSLDVTFTYSSSWIPTDAKYSDRNKLVRTLATKELEIHWLSILNSVGLVLLLTSFLAVILRNIIRKDINRYTKSVSLESEEDDDLDDYGWKLVHGDVFRYPSHKIYLCALLGVGVQLLFVSSSLLVLSAVGILYPEQIGSLYGAAVLMIAFGSILSGGVSGGFYKKLQGENWAWNLVLAASLLVLPVAGITVGANIIAWFYKSTTALPFMTGLQMFLIWVFVGFPLTILGGITGRRLVGPFDAPVRTKNAVREIPPIPFYRQAPVQLMIGGFLPFSAIYIELHYLYATLWGHSSYGLYGILLLVFVILLIVTACITISLTYFQLSIEDHRWWWRSFCCAGSTAIFVFLYSVYYYFYLSQMSGLLQVVKYFGFVTSFCYLFFVMLGTVGFYSSLVFVRYIYHTLKID